MVSPCITFLSDYGTDDEFVGVCHAVMARIAPGVRVIDLAHGIRGIRACSAALAQAVPYAPEGSVHLAVCDPGVGTDRRGLVIETRSAAVLVGPDNGLLPSAADALGGVRSAFELVEPRYRLDPVSSTFHGRDVFAPACAHLARGAGPETFGPPVADLVRLPTPLIEPGPGVLRSDVLRAEGFGNVQLAARGEHLGHLGGGVDVNGLPGRVVRTFADVPRGELAVFVDAAGHVSVAVNLGSAWERLERPEIVTIRRR